MSDLFGNHIVGFPTRWLICIASWFMKIISILALSSDANISLGYNAGACLLCVLYGDLKCFCFLHFVTG